MKVITPAWNSAFDAIVNLKAWAMTGIAPFTMSVLHQLEQSEQSSTASASVIDYTPLNSVSGLGAGRVPAGENEEEAGEEDDGEPGESVRVTGRLTSAQLYNLGPVTADAAYQMLKAKEDERAGAKAAEQNRARVERAESKAAKLEELRAAIGDFVLQSKARASTAHDSAVARLAFA